MYKLNNTPTKSSFWDAKVNSKTFSDNKVNSSAKSILNTNLQLKNIPTKPSINTVHPLATTIYISFVIIWFL